ncbi:hypothetical protein HanXRQr2_Chr04g0183111 [Helianthus annuus]|uniref:Uncharacterized protein n=1 Tax=Helianthus annuus TaxID=4232 RepID=A0A9K3JA46_HELAN|nr:hypothetical protein HanXRQr2_Chr04g0183111 [Helianthus annuus]KAJ0932693.1 hypothetical protein HanPSC8_Chr04g0176571 [Helianthus annuus]
MVRFCTRFWYGRTNSRFEGGSTFPVTMAPPLNLRPPTKGFPSPANHMPLPQLSPLQSLYKRHQHRGCCG